MAQRTSKSSTIMTEGRISALRTRIEERNMRIRTHPGEILREEFMKPLGLSANALSIALRVPATRIGAIIREDKPRAVTADTALRLGRYFGTSAQFWLNLQSAYDLSVAEQEIKPVIDRDRKSTRLNSSH